MPWAHRPTPLGSLVTFLSSSDPCSELNFKSPCKWYASRIRGRYWDDGNWFRPFLRSLLPPLFSFPSGPRAQKERPGIDWAIPPMRGGFLAWNREFGRAIFCQPTNQDVPNMWMTWNGIPNLPFTVPLRMSGRGHSPHQGRCRTPHPAPCQE